MSSDEQMDARLAREGQRWRGANSEPAAVDLAALAATADPGPVPDRDGASSPVPLPLISDPEPAIGRRRARVWLASAVGIAAAIAATVLAVQIGTGSPGSHDRAASSGGTPLVGTHWLLSGLAGANGMNSPLAKQVELIFDPAGVHFSDGCNSGGGEATASGSTITFGRLVTTLMGCLNNDAPLGKQIMLIDGVLKGTVHYAIDGDTLTLTKAGVGSLTYTAARPAASPAVTGAAQLAGAWDLTTISPGSNVARSFGTSSSAPPNSRLTFAGGELTGSVGCWSVSAPVTVGGGTISVGKVELSGGAGCGDSQEFAIVLRGAATWQASATRLTLSDTHGGQLVFTRELDPGFSGLGGSGGASGTATPATLPSATATK